MEYYTKRSKNQYYSHDCMSDLYVEKWESILLLGDMGIQIYIWRNGNPY